jgi:uncharacterized membrane protein YadS
MKVALPGIAGQRVEALSRWKILLSKGAPMVYTTRNPAVLIIGFLLLAFGFAVQSGWLDGLINFLNTKGHKGEMIYLPYVFGVIGLVVGIAKLAGPQTPGHLDYYRSAIGGALFILVLAMVIRWLAAPLVAVFSKYLGDVHELKFGGQYIHGMLGLNYVVLGILAGIITVNVFGIPTWAQNGVRLSRLGLKTGVILLGTLYFLQEILKLGVASFTLIGLFVLGSVGLVLLFGRMMHIPNSMGGVLSAGVGVCGVSASVAAAPVVQAKSAEIAYTIGTILIWGVGCMFIFPVVGKAMGLSHEMFGAWAGTGILNSAQVAGAALAFQPNGIETLKVAEIFNITRILFLPIIVLWLAMWYVRRETAHPVGTAAGGHSVSAMAVEAPKVDVWHVVISKFPLFVLGFILMFLINLKGITADDLWKGKYFDNQLKAEKLLSDKDLATLQRDASKVNVEAQGAALSRLVTNRKVMSMADVHALDGLARSGVLSKDGKKAVEHANKAVLHTPKIVSWFRDWIVWLFAFGLTGLGMQITGASLRQAGGAPLVIGGIVGTLKALGSLLFILAFAAMLGLTTL